jgi:hypothetical protein
MSESEWEETTVVAVSKSSEVVIPARTDGTRYQVKQHRYVPVPNRVSPEAWIREVTEICEGLDDVLIETLDAIDDEPTEMVAEGWVDVIDSRIPMTDAELRILETLSS